MESDLVMVSAPDSPPDLVDSSDSESESDSKFDERSDTSEFEELMPRSVTSETMPREDQNTTLTEAERNEAERNHTLMRSSHEEDEMSLVALLKLMLAKRKALQDQIQPPTPPPLWAKKLLNDQEAAKARIRFLANQFYGNLHLPQEGY